MNSLQQLAVLLVRIISAAWLLFFALGWGIYAGEAAVGVNVQHYPTHTIIGNIAFVVAGLVVLVFSKAIGRSLSRGLGE